MKLFDTEDAMGVLDDGTQRIYPRAFLGRTDLTSIVIPEGVTEIGMYAFRNCI